MMLQPYLEAVESEGELSSIVIDGKVTHSVRKVPAAGDYRVQDEYGARDERVELTGEQEKLVGDVMGSLAWDLLYARVDFLRDAEGKFCVTEVELVEPSLFFRHGPESAEALAGGLCRRLGAG